MTRLTFSFASMIALLLLLFNSCLVFAGTADSTHDKTYNILDFGAVADGQTINTAAINQAIGVCAAKGGGTVQVPAGNFVTGTILLKSNVTFWLHADAYILGTRDLHLYKSTEMGPEDPSRPINITVKDSGAWTRSLVLLANVHDVAIKGTGTIDGGSLVDQRGEEGHRGPHGIFIVGSKNITISGIRIARSGNYNIIGLHVSDLIFNGLTILQGADGIHIRDGKNLLIENCKFYTADDAIAGGYWQNMLIKDCLINSSCNGIRVILPATNLEIKNCEISGPGVFGHRRGNTANPLVTESLTGIILQPGAWGAGAGKLDHIDIHHIRIRDMQTAFTIVLNENNQSANITVTDLVATGITKNACSVEGWPNGSIYNDIQLKNLDISYTLNADSLLKTVGFRRPLTESRPLPFWGFYFRNIKSIVLENVKLSYAGTENRPAMAFEKVGKVLLKKVRYQKVAGIPPFKYEKGMALTLVNTAGFN